MLSPGNHKQFYKNPHKGSLNLFVAAFCIFLNSACVPKKADTGNSEGKSTTSVSPLFTVISLKVGGSQTPVIDGAGVLYSRYDPLTISGACRGEISSIQIEVTPLASSTVIETVPCSGTLYSWSKNFTTETSYTIVLTALDADSNPASGFTPITKDYVYDVTDPGAPTFLTPTTGTTYSVSNGQTAFTITGQVLMDVTELLGPGLIPVTLTANGDTIHQDFSYSITIPVGSSSTPTFLAYDRSRNSSTSSMTLTSILSTVIPVAAADAGGSVVSGGLIIHSTLGARNGISTNSNLGLITGAAGIVGSDP